MTASPSIHAIGDRNSCRCDPSQRLPFVSFSSRLRDISNFAEREIYRNCRGEYRGNYIERRSAPYIDRPRRLARSAFYSTKGKEYRGGCVSETAHTKNECALTSFPNEVLCRAFLQESARPPAPRRVSPARERFGLTLSGPTVCASKRNRAPSRRTRARTTGSGTFPRAGRTRRRRQGTRWARACPRSVR